MKDLTENQMAALDKIAAQHPEPATHGHLIAGFLHADATAEDLRKEITELRTKVAMLEARASGLESRSFDYKGIWRDGIYRKGNFCSYQGALWFCEDEETTARPGAGVGWRLAVKSGKQRT